MRAGQAARAYPTETEIAQASAEFPDWSSLIAAGFPAYDVALDEPPADHRIEDERDHDRIRALMDLIGEQGTPISPAPQDGGSADAQLRRELASGHERRHS